MTPMRRVPENRNHSRSLASESIRAHIDDSGRSGVSVAKELGLSQSAFSRRYCGYMDWSAGELLALANLLGISVADLLESDTKASA